MKKIIWTLVAVMAIGVVSMRVIENNTAPKLGVIEGQLKALGSRPNSVSSQTDIKSKLVKPISYAISTEQQMAKVLSVIEKMPGAELKQHSDNYAYAVFTSALMRFKDDVEVYLDEESKLTHFRSASRIGYSDLGANRKRYEAFAAHLSSL